MNTKKKEIQIKNWLEREISDGDDFYIKGDDSIKCHALGLRGQLMIYNTSKNTDARLTINISDKRIYKKEEDYKGPNPFSASTIRFSAFGIESIFSYIGIDRDKKSFKVDNDGDGMIYNYFNWNPYFIINGEKVHYQRGYVWSLEQKQALINSIYRGLEIGRIIVHNHSYDFQEKMVRAGYTDFAARDIVDGKQRLSTIVDFYFDKFPDEFGNYYSELSDSAKRKFQQYSGCLYGEMDEHSSYEQVCNAFLNNATQGTPISIEHIKFMSDIKQQLINK